MYVYEIIDENSFIVTNDNYKSIFKGNEDLAISIIKDMNNKDANILKKKMLEDVRKYYSEQYTNALLEYSDNEKATFLKQETEYEAWILDNDINTPTVNRLATSRNVDRIELLNKIGSHIILRDNMTGFQQAKEDEIKSCKTIIELKNIEIPKNI
jgi:NAD(P)H-dependent flavin oxidoreductase YrpB (nitropropane dioxygenase family)